jgi:ferredoxin-like protein FixX
MRKVNVEEKLGYNKFYVNESEAHIELKEGEIDPNEFLKLVLACPANCYKVAENGGFHFDYAGCLECGTCRVLCGSTILKKWEYPLGTMGVEYRFGWRH